MPRFAVRSLLVGVLPSLKRRTFGETVAPNGAEEAKPDDPADRDDIGSAQQTQKGCASDPVICFIFSTCELVHRMPTGTDPKIDQTYTNNHSETTKTGHALATHGSRDGLVGRINTRLFVVS